MASAEARLRFLYCCNIALPGFLAIVHLLAPDVAARAMWGGHAKPGLLLTMAGSWWAGISLVSALGLRNPLRYSPVALLQIVYKVFFLSFGIWPRLVAGRPAGGWDAALPSLPTAIFAAYLPLLLATAPWGYLLGGCTEGTVTDGHAVARKAD